MHGKLAVAVVFCLLERFVTNGPFVDHLGVHNVCFGRLEGLSGHGCHHSSPVSGMMGELRQKRRTSFSCIARRNEGQAGVVLGVRRLPVMGCEFASQSQIGGGR